MLEQQEAGQPAIQQASMKERMEPSDLAVAAVTRYLNAQPTTVSVVNVERDKRYQVRDIDLLLIRLASQLGSREQLSAIEVKGDTYTSGNFFYEVQSNSKKRTPGCFMHSEADYFFYLFLATADLYILPLDATRRWFMMTEAFNDRSKWSETQTKEGSRVLYSTYGVKVPIRRVMEEVPGVIKVNIREHLDAARNELADLKAAA